MQLRPSSDGSPSFLKEGNTEYMGATSRAKHLTSLVAVLNSQEAIWHSTCIKVNALPPETDEFLTCTFLFFDKAIKKCSMLPLLDLNLFPSWNLYQSSKQNKWEHFTYQENQMLENPVRLGGPAAVERSHPVRDFLCCHSASVQQKHCWEPLCPQATSLGCLLTEEPGSEPSTSPTSPAWQDTASASLRRGESAHPQEHPPHQPLITMSETAEVPAGRWSLSKLSWLTLVGKGRGKTPSFDDWQTVESMNFLVYVDKSNLCWHCFVKASWPFWEGHQV